MPADEAKRMTIWIKSNWRLLAAATAGTLLIVAFVVVVATAPISELVVTFRNAEDADTVHLVVYLDNSPVADIYVGAHGLAKLKLHVSPGTYAVGCDLAHDGHPDETIDFLWTTHIDFNGVETRHLLIGRDGIGPDALVDYALTNNGPISQAVRDPNVMIPALALAVLHMVLVIAVWNHLRRGASVVTPGRSMEKE